MKVAASAAACPKCGGSCSCFAADGQAGRLEMRSAHSTHMVEAAAQEKAASPTESSQPAHDTVQLSAEGQAMHAELQKQPHQAESMPS